MSCYGGGGGGQHARPTFDMLLLSLPLLLPLLLLLPLRLPPLLPRVDKTSTDHTHVLKCQYALLQGNSQGAAGLLTSCRGRLAHA